MLGVGAVAVAAAACVAWALWGRGRPAAESHAPPPPIDETRLPVVPFRLPPVRKLPEAPVDAADDARRQAVETAFHQSWDAYRRHAWGRDEFHPLSKTGSNLLANDTAPLGYTIVDTLDSLILLGWRDAYEEARDWVRDELHWHIDGRLNVFETTIRMLGGLLSASALMLDPPPGTLARSPADAAMFLAKAERLAERLAPAFDTPSGIPKREINLATGASFYDTDNRNASSLAEFTTVQLELKYLAHRTRNETYWRMSERPMGVVRASTAPPHPGILPLFADPKSGHFYAGEIRLGSRADSYYEYLVKQYLLTNRTEPVYRDMYEQAFDGIKSYLLGHVTAANDTFVHTVEMVPRRASNAAGFAWARRNKQDHLVCFLGGTMMLAASSLRPGPPAPPTTASGVPAAFREDWRVGHELTKACVNTYTASATGLGAEIVFFHAPEEQALQPEGRAWRVKRYVLRLTPAAAPAAPSLTRATSCARRPSSPSTSRSSLRETPYTASGAGTSSKASSATAKWTEAGADTPASTTSTTRTRARSTAWKRTSHDSHQILALRNAQVSLFAVRAAQRAAAAQMGLQHRGPSPAGL